MGKTAILEGLVSRIVAKEVPESLQNKRVPSIDLASIMAGSGIRGQFGEKFKASLRDIEDEAGYVICFIDEVREYLCSRLNPIEALCKHAFQPRQGGGLH